MNEYRRVLLENMTTATRNTVTINQPKRRESEILVVSETSKKAKGTEEIMAIYLHILK